MPYKFNPIGDPFDVTNPKVPYVSDTAPDDPSDGDLWWDTDDETNIGAVRGPDSSVNGNIATFNGTSGDTIQDGGSTIAEVLDRTNHTGTQTAATISDFDTEVSNNTDVTANTAKVTNATHTGEVTGATVLTIADNIVDEANLKLDTAPTNDYVLTADSGESGGMKWAEITTVSPAIIQREDTAGATITATPATVAFATSDILDTGYTFSAGEVTIGSALNGKRAVIDVAITIDNGSNRTELQIYLDADTGTGYSTVREAYNYATRDANQDQGSAHIHGHVVTLATGDKYRVQAATVVDGGTPVLNGTGNWFTIRTID